MIIILVGDTGYRGPTGEGSGEPNRRATSPNRRAQGRPWQSAVLEWVCRSYYESLQGQESYEANYDNDSHRWQKLVKQKEGVRVRFLDMAQQGRLSNGGQSNKPLAERDIHWKQIIDFRVQLYDLNPRDEPLPDFKSVLLQLPNKSSRLKWHSPVPCLPLFDRLLMEHAGDRFATEALLNAFQSIRIETMKIYYRQQRIRLHREERGPTKYIIWTVQPIVQSLVDEELGSVTGKAFVHEFDATISQARAEPAMIGWSPMGGPLFDMDHLDR